MKWPLSLTIIRHGQSAYNILRDKKKADPEYQEFLAEFKKDYTSARARELAQSMMKRYGAQMSDYDTLLTAEGINQAVTVGGSILRHVHAPDVIFVSPYMRTHQTLAGIILRNAELRDTKMVVEDRIREQEHGLQLLYGDWRVFQTLHPEQKLLHDVQGPYWYQYPQGESVSMVRDRIRAFLQTLTREYAGEHVWLISHHLTKLSIRANLERLSPEAFMRLDRDEKPINCGVTTYVGNPDVGEDGRLELKEYNLKLY